MGFQPTTTRRSSRFQAGTEGWLRSQRTVLDIAKVIWEACGEDPEAFQVEHLPSFEVDVVRRWPSVAKAKRLLGWEAKIPLDEGIAQTVRWLRSQPSVPA